MISRFGLQPRQITQDDVDRATAEAASRADFIVLVFVIGVFLGTLI